MCVSGRIDSIAKGANFQNNTVRKMGFGWLDGGEDSENNYISFVEISRILVMQDALIFGNRTI